MREDDQVDVVLRFHDSRRLPELERCVFSLAGQSYRPLHIDLALQRFSSNEIAATRTALARLLATENAPTITLLNWEEPYPVDARSMLLNLGLKSAHGRYIAFLDYEGVLYPEAYELMIARLRERDAAIVFATVRQMRLEAYSHFFYLKEKVIPPLSGSNLIDLFRHNFCSLHSYVIDRDRVADNNLFFETALGMEQDYDLLLRICAQFRSDFSLARTSIGDCYHTSDGSNRVTTSRGLNGGSLAEHESAMALIEGRRRTTQVALEVQRTIGVPVPRPKLSIRGVLDLLEV